MASKALTVRADETTTPNRIYVGVADTGSIETDPVWRIKVIDKTLGGSSLGDTILWCEGRSSYQIKMG